MEGFASFFSLSFSFSSVPPLPPAAPSDSTAERQRRVWLGQQVPPARNTSGTSLFMGDAAASLNQEDRER